MLGLLKVELEALAVKLIIVALSEKALGSLAVFRPQELLHFNLPVTPHIEERITCDRIIFYLSLDKCFYQADLYYFIQIATSY